MCEICTVSHHLFGKKLELLASYFNSRVDAYIFINIIWFAQITFHWMHVECSNSLSLSRGRQHHFHCCPCSLFPYVPSLKIYGILLSIFFAFSDLPITFLPVSYSSLCLSKVLSGFWLEICVDTFTLLYQTSYSLLLPRVNQVTQWYRIPYIHTHTPASAGLQSSLRGYTFPPEFSHLLCLI